MQGVQIGGNTNSKKTPAIFAALKPPPTAKEKATTTFSSASTMPTLKRVTEEQDGRWGLSACRACLERGHLCTATQQKGDHVKRTW